MNVRETVTQRLVRNAIDCTNYVALGDSMANDLIQQGLAATLPEAREILAREATAIHKHLNLLLRRRTAE